MKNQPNNPPAFPQFTTDSWNKPVVHGGLSLRDYFAANELLSDMCCEVWDMNEQYVESIMGRKIPENLNSLEAAKYEAEFFARMRYIRADAMLAVRGLQPDTSTAQQIALGIGGGE